MMSCSQVCVLCTVVSNTSSPVIRLSSLVLSVDPSASSRDLHRSETPHTPKPYACVCTGGYHMPGKRAKPVPGPQRRVLLPQGHVATASTLTVTRLTLRSYTPHLSAETQLHSHRHGIVCACAGRVACLHSDNLPDSPTLCPYVCALRCPRYPSVTSPLCAALAIVVLVTRVLTQGGTRDGTELAPPSPRRP